MATKYEKTIFHKLEMDKDPFQVNGKIWRVLTTELKKIHSCNSLKKTRLAFINNSLKRACKNNLDD